jgi:hypothetical protein
MAPATLVRSNASPAGMLPLRSGSHLSVAHVVIPQSWCRCLFVPPSGIEPEPLGLQPSAQTNYAREGCLRCACDRALGRARSIAQRDFHRHQLFSCQRAPAYAGRTSGVDAAARAGACAGAPISIRYLDWESRYRVAESDCVSGIAARDVGWIDPKTSKGRWGGLPWAALQLATCGHVVSGGDPRGYRWPDRAFRSHSSTQTPE